VSRSGHRSSLTMFIWGFGGYALFGALLLEVVNHASVCPMEELFPLTWFPVASLILIFDAFRVADHYEGVLQGYGNMLRCKTVVVFADSQSFLSDTFQRLPLSRLLQFCYPLL